MVLAISFLEAPLKFRVLDVRSGLAVGRLVFKALNAVEVVLGVAVVVALTDAHTALRTAAGTVAILALASQLVGVRPALTRRSDLVLAGEDGPRSRAHLWYVGLELIKVLALLTLGVAALHR
jgi:hypothetical protein